MKILYDTDIRDHLTYRGAIVVLEELLRSKLDQNVVHPPRHTMATQHGSLTFTMGELLREEVAGFRLYGAPKSTQMTLVMDTRTGAFKGLIFGKLIGVFRTACLNAVAIKYLARAEANVLGVLGTGFQARHHVLAAVEVRDFQEIHVYSRQPENRAAFIRFLQERLDGKKVRILAADQATTVTSISDVLITATNSSSPIFPAGTLKTGVHINNVGPKYKERHELPLECYLEADVLSTDSLPQLYAENHLGTVCFADQVPRERVRGLEACMSGFQRTPEAQSLFCSMGLAGSEVALADWLLNISAKNTP